MKSESTEYLGFKTAKIMKCSEGLGNCLVFDDAKEIQSKMIMRVDKRIFRGTIGIIERRQFCL